MGRPGSLNTSLPAGGAPISYRDSRVTDERLEADRSAQRTECGARFEAEQIQLFSDGEVTAFFYAIEVDKIEVVQSS
jgi:hypothetical protein